MLGDDKATHHCEAEKDRIAYEKQTKSENKPFLEEGNERAACAISEKGKANNHGDEMLPLDDA